MENGTQIESYKLPVTDTQAQKRNFPGADKKVYYSLQDLKAGDLWGGTTETDADTSSKDDEASTSINKKRGKSRWPNKSSAKNG
jgi:hypothetical protein